MKQSKIVTQTYKISNGVKKQSLHKIVSNLAHEIRNPLSIIKTSSNFCLDELDLRGKVKEHLKVIRRNTEYANKLIDNFLDFVWPKKLHLQRTSINQILAYICDLVPQGTRHGVRLVKRFSSGIPQIIADRSCLEQAFFNIVLNSLEAMPNGGTLSVSSSFESSPSPISDGRGSPKVVHVQISDTGIGIPKKNLRRIFNSSFTTKEKGIGLGFTIARQVITAHKGNIVVKSKKGQGTTVEIKLPVLNTNAGRPQVISGRNNHG